MKSNSSLTKLLVTTAIACGTVAVSINPAQAFPCSAFKGQAAAPTTTTSLDPTMPVTKNFDGGKFLLGVAGIAGTISVFSLMASRKRQEAATSLAEATSEQTTAPEYIVETVLVDRQDESTTALGDYDFITVEAAEKELTRV